MPRFFIQLAYDGAPFNGWQIQPDRPSVQQNIENALATILHAPTPIVGAGRTDTGVHAHMMIAHVDLPDKFLDPFTREGLRRSLAGLCRPAIAIQAITPVHNDAHARFDASNRTYHYYLHTLEDPFLVGRSLLFHRELDFTAMNQAAELMLGTRDFTSFSKLHTQTKTNICTLTKAHWEQISPTRYRFVISANRFLRNMVRATVGTLLNVGVGERTPSQITEVIDGKNRSLAGESVPGYALYLWNIEYPGFTPVEI